MTHLFNRPLLSALLISGLFACNNGKDETDTVDSDDTEVEVCTSGITSTFPDGDATGVFYRTAIEIVFTKDESSTATITLATAAGTDVPGTVTFSSDGKTAAFAPSADLAATTAYELTIAYSCDKTAVIAFTTSDAGTPLADPSTIVGNTYNIDITTGRITKPAGVGATLMGLIEGEEFYILVSPTEYSAEDETLAFLGALGVDDGAGNVVQDECTETINFPLPADFAANPFMTISGEDVPLAVAGVELELGRIDLSGAFSPDGDTIEGLSLTAFADTVALGPLLDLGDICELITTFGVNCIDCGDGSVTCLELQIDNMTADVQVGSLTPIATEDIDTEVCGE
jgi:hypothetical protein